MKPVLVLALGNPFVGDDAVGCVVAEAAAADPEVAERAEVLCAGTDLFRVAPRLAGRSRLVVVDAALTDAPDASIRCLPHPPPTADRRLSAHALDPVAAIDLLRSLEPELAVRDTWWLLIEVPEIRQAAGLSPAVTALVPEAVAVLRAAVLAAPYTGAQGTGAQGTGV